VVHQEKEQVVEGGTKKFYGSDTEQLKDSIEAVVEENQGTSEHVILDGIKALLSVRL
jgi:hypothetical protein